MSTFALPRLLAAALSCSFVVPPGFATASEAIPESAFDPVEPQIVAGALVSGTVQKNLGLVTVAGGCSGTLLNRFWVLTADHCVASNGQVGGPSGSFANTPITAVWSTRRVIPTRFVRYWIPFSQLDVALVFLGAGDFGDVPAQQLAVGQIANDTVLTKYGRGIFAYARTGGSPPAPIAAAQDGRYRTAQFNVSASSAPTYTLAANGTNQVGNGGDSGGPDRVTIGSDTAIAGVQSTCVWTTCLAGQSCTLPGGGVNWSWVTNISSCNSAPIFSLRLDINNRIQEGFNPCGTAVNCGMTEISRLLLLK